MIKPNIIQPNAVNKVVESSVAIIAPQTKIPKIGTNGTIGVLNGRALSGSALRMMMMPRQTSTNASRVPIDVRSPATLPGINAPKKPTNKNRIIFDL